MLRRGCDWARLRGQRQRRSERPADRRAGLHTLAACESLYGPRMDLGIVTQIDQDLAELAISQTLKWKTKGNYAVAEVPLKNKIGARLTFYVRVGRLAPHRPTVLIRDDGRSPNNAFRLDVRGVHINRQTDGRVWDPGSHLHRWSPSCGSAHAIDPLSPPWPPPNWDEQKPGAQPEELRAVVENFCRMLHIRFDAATMWTDPELAPQPITLPDGDEIP